MSAAGNVRIRFDYPEGTEGEAIPLARSLVQVGRQFLYAQKQQQFINPGMRQFTRHIRLPDGSIIRARSAFGQDELIIDVTGSESLPSSPRSCAVLWSGLANIISPIFPVEVFTDESGEEYNAVREFYFRKVDEETEATTYGPWEESEELAPKFANSTTNPLKRSAGKYTGKMRGLVQYLSGLEGSDIPYSYTYLKTHGLVLSGGTPWIVEISQANGVWAAPLPLCKAKKGEELLADDGYKALGFIPAPGQSLQTIFTAENAIELIPGAGVRAAFYDGKLPYFSACGWAFNESGTEAQNTNQGFVDSWKHGYRNKVTLTFNADGPTGATISDVDDGVLRGDRVNHFKFPHEEESSLLSFDLFYSSPQYTAGPIDTAFYVFYDGDSEVVCRYQSGVTYPDVEIDNITGIGRLTDSGMPAADENYGVLLRRGTLHSDKPGGAVIVGLHEDRDDGEAMSNTAIERYTLTTTEGTPVDIFGASVNDRSWSEAAEGEGNSTVSDGTYNLYTQYMVLVPFSNREAVYRFEQDYEEINYGPHTARTGGMFRGIQSIAWRADECHYDGGLTGVSSSLWGSMDPSWRKHADNPLKTLPELSCELLPFQANTAVAVGTPLQTLLNNKSRLFYVASGGIDVEVRTSTTDSTQNQYMLYLPNTNISSQWLYSNPEIFSGEFMTSSEINANVFTEYYQSPGLDASFPLPEGNSLNVFWLGVPTPVS